MFINFQLIYCELYIFFVISKNKIIAFFSCPNTCFTSLYFKNLYFVYLLLLKSYAIQLSMQFLIPSRKHQHYNNWQLFFIIQFHRLLINIFHVSERFNALPLFLLFNSNVIFRSSRLTIHQAGQLNVTLTKNFK